MKNFQIFFKTVEEIVDETTRNVSHLFTDLVFSYSELLSLIEFRAFLMAPKKDQPKAKGRPKNPETQIAEDLLPWQAAKMKMFADFSPRDLREAAKHCQSVAQEFLAFADSLEDAKLQQTRVKGGDKFYRGMKFVDLAVAKIAGQIQVDVRMARKTH